MELPAVPFLPQNMSKHNCLFSYFKMCFPSDLISSTQMCVDLIKLLLMLPFHFVSVRLSNTPVDGFKLLNKTKLSEVGKH